MISANISNATRKAVYKREGYTCAICSDNRGLQVHHAILRSQGGSNSLHNLITLCWKCHAIAHGTKFPESPDYINAEEMQQSCIEYLADYYAPNWNPWRKEP